MPAPIPTLELAGIGPVPILGQGTWRMGERGADRDAEAEALRHGIDLGLTLIDTAEMYGNGGAERVVADAIAGRRDTVQLVSKVLPYNASRRGTIAACEQSLARLGTDRLDLYLLHWRGSHPLAETVAGLEELRRDGRIRAWGVSNFDVDDMEDVLAVPGGAHCAVNQVLYNLGARGIEYDLFGWSAVHRIPIMAYSPLGNDGRLLRHPELVRIAAARDATPAQVALAFVLARDNVVAIPKAARRAHLADNRAALDHTLDAADHAALDRAFPPPRRKQPLAML